VVNQKGALSLFFIVRPALYWFMPIVIIGCASSIEKPYNKASQAPSGMGRVYVISPDTPCANWGFFGTTIFINKAAKFSLSENNYSSVDLQPGSHELTTSTDRQAMCHDGGRSNWASVVVELKPGDVKFIKYGSEVGIPSYCVSTCERRLIIIDQANAETQLQGADYVPAK
jgi:hypothetical protein